MLVGTCGAIAFSIYIKRTFNFKLALRSIALASVAALLLLCLWLNTANLKLGTSLIISLLGFVLTPLVPVAYDLGCELAFPLGEAQVTGLLNGGALLWAFLASTLVATTVGFSSSSSSLLTMIVLSLFILTGAVLFFLVNITLKRHQYEQRQSPTKVDPESPKKADANTESSTEVTEYSIGS
jgi:MFS transporter, FLVCR family, feline leukemia virus subgroup C receptor-related protein